MLNDVGTSAEKTELCGTDGQSCNKRNGTQKVEKVAKHVPVPITYASAVVAKKIAKKRSEVVGHQKNEIRSKLILLSQSTPYQIKYFRSISTTPSINCQGDTERAYFQQ